VLEEMEHPKEILLDKTVLINLAYQQHRAAILLLEQLS
jgi:hypothetical protein